MPKYIIKANQTNTNNIINKETSTTKTSTTKTPTIITTTAKQQKMKE
jgi:hypothetical protein